MKKHTCWRKVMEKSDTPLFAPSLLRVCGRGAGWSSRREKQAGADSTVKMVNNLKELLRPHVDGHWRGCWQILLLGAGRRARRGLHLQRDMPSLCRLHCSSHWRGPCPPAAAFFGTWLDCMEEVPLPCSYHVFE